MPDISDLLLAEDLSDQDIHALLVPLGFRNPHAVDSALQRMCPDPSSRLALAGVLHGVLEAAARSASPEQCLLQLDRLAEMYGQRGVLYRALGEDPRTLDILFTVVSTSRALADVLVLNPEYLEILSDAEALSWPKTLDELRLESARAGELFRTRDGVLNALRRLRRREYLRIGARELTGLGTFTDVVQEISDLASAIVAETLAACHEALPFAGEDRPDSFAVVAFGKLGARELNYSSDIDLAFVWDSPPPERDAPCTAFYRKLAQSLMDGLSELSHEGRMYRVDMRLRPFGKSGPIGCSLAQFFSYYESWSEPWERQALIKARTVAGPSHLRARVDEFIQDFTFARPLDSSSISQILALKDRSESFRAQSGSMERQVKHGWGGIRDVEFTVQLLQLVVGVGEESARAPATLDALRALADMGALSPKEEAALSSAYVFLRQVEHRLQLAEELPMQSLPDDPGQLRNLAISMGYRDETPSSAAGLFMEDYERNTQSVRVVHERLFKQFATAEPEGPALLWSMVESDTDESSPLKEFGFRHPDEALRRLRQIARGAQLAPVSSEPQRRFLQALPGLLPAIGGSPDPDLSLSQLQRIAEATGSPLSFFRSIASHPRAMDIFARLAGASEFLAESMVRHPEYIDMFADPTVLARPRTLGQLQTDLLERVRAQPAGEERLNALRRFRLREFLRIGVRDVAEVARVTTTTAEISLLAEACIRVALALADGSVDGPSRLPGRMSILGMGKLGGRELHYSSDVDIVCVYEEDGPDAFRAFDKAVRVVLDALSRLTSEGRGFKVDLRLRPEGKAGMLALSLTGYQRYFQESIQAWERQALIRARWTAGDRGLGRRLLEEMQQAVWGVPLTRADLDELRHIKRRIENERSSQSDKLIDIKLGPGGILDIEFTAQMLQLAWGGVLAGVREPNTVRALRKLGEAGLLSPEDAHTLTSAYLFLRRAENRLQMVSEQSADGVPLDPDALATFARRLGYAQKRDSSAGQAFQDDLGVHTGRVRTIHESVFFQTDLSRPAWGAPGGK